MQVICHLSDASKDDLPLSKLRRLSELLKKFHDIFQRSSKRLGGMHLQWPFFLSRAARAMPQVLEEIKICFTFAWTVNLGNKHQQTLMFPLAPNIQSFSHSRARLSKSADYVRAGQMNSKGCYVIRTKAYQG